MSMSSDTTMTMTTVPTTKHFSGPLFNQTFRANLAITIAVLVISCLIAFVLTFAMSMVGEMFESISTMDEYAFYDYLTALAANGYTFDQFRSALAAGDTAEYEALFSSLAGAGGFTYAGGTVAELEEIIMSMENSKAGLDAYLSNFEYYYALAGQTGVWSGQQLSINGVLMSMIGLMGISQDTLMTMGDMDTSVMMNMMYYHMVGIIPILIWIVVVGNSVIASQVDRGSMAYVLSTPTTRGAVVSTQVTYMVVVPFVMELVTCCVKVACNAAFNGDANAASVFTLFLGEYILVESMCGICFLGSCLFNRSSYSMAFGGSFVVWFFLATIVGMFGSDMMVNAGMGVESLNAFNYLTLITLFDTDAAGTVGSGAVDLNFLWEYAILIVVAAGTYLAGSLRFCKKDLPL